MHPGAPSGCGTTDTQENLLVRIKRRVGCGFEPRLFDVLRATPSPLDARLLGLESLFDSCLIRTSADMLRDEADRLSSNHIELRGHLDWLAGNGSSREQSRQVRYVVETFHILEPVLAIVAAAARELLSGRPFARGIRGTGCPPGPITLAADIDFAAESKAAALFRGIAREGAPHAFLRALAVWPDYVGKVRQDLSDDHRAALARIGAELRSWVGQLVFQSGSGVNERNSAGSPGLLRALDDCVEASCDVIPLIAALRRGLIQDEIRARQRRARESGW